MQERIAAHRRNRPPGWLTVEVPVQVAETLTPALLGADTVVLDCLTLLASNVMMDVARTLGDESPSLASSSHQRLRQEIEAILSAIHPFDARLIVVTNEVGEGIVPDNRFARLYRDLLGWANAYLAERASKVFLMVAGLPVDIKLLSRETEQWLAHR
jgi:adenosylcobinamide kinase/adenosylcobinamide-phosphate guanylyltransferase